MTNEVREFAVEKTKELMEAFSCSPETKESAQAWLDAVGTDREAEATAVYVKALEGDIMPIDMLIAFAGTEGGAQVFGAEKAKEVKAHAEEIKAAGAAYCDCPACAAVEAILAKKEELLK